MKPSELPNALRELANRIEAHDLPEEFSADVSLSVHGVDNREALAKWAAFMVKPELITLNSDSNALKLYGWRAGNPIDMTVFFRPGLLGGAVRRVADDTHAGLGALWLKSQPAIYTPYRVKASPSVAAHGRRGFLHKGKIQMPYKAIPIKRGFTEVAALFDLCQQFGATICGGYARYCASPKKTDKVVAAGDADLFPHSQDAHEKILAALQQLGYVIAHENHVSITLKPTDEKKSELEYIPTPQIIKPVVEGRIVTTGTTEEILDNFDFTIVRAAIVSPVECLVDEDFESDESKGLLRLKNIHCPISSLLRCCKYARKGYFLRPAEALKLFVDWTDRGEDYRNRMVELFIESGKGKASDKNPDGMTQEEIDELEALLRID